MRFLRHSLSIHPHSPKNPSDVWRERIFFAIFLSSVLIGAVSYISTLSYAIDKGHLANTVIFYTPLYLCAIIILVVRRLPFVVRAGIGLFIFYGLGLATLITVGPVGSGSIWLFAFAVTATLLLGLRAGVIALAINICTLLILGQQMSAGHLDWLLATPYTTKTWNTTLATFAFLNAVIVISLAVLVRSLEKALKEEYALTNELTEMNKQLEQEIAERKRTTKELAESEEKYRTLFEDSLEAMSLTEDGRIIDVNAAWLRMHGYEYKSDVIGMDIMDIIYHEDREILLERRERWPHNQTRLCQFRDIQKDGSLVDVEVYSSEISLGDRYAILATIRDIGERKRAEEALRESEARFRLLTESSPFGIAVIGKDDRYKYVNPKFIEIFGFTLKDILTGGEWSRAWNPAKGGTDMTSSAWIADKEEARSGVDKAQTSTVRCKDGSEKIIDSRAVTMDNGDRFIIFEDITERVRLEARLQQAQKMEAIGILAGGVAHDLNNILAGLVSFPELLLLDIPEESHLRGPILTIQRSGQKAADVVQDLLTLARRGVAISEVVNLNDIVSEYLNSPEHEKLKSHHGKIHVETSLEPDLLNILGSRVHLTKIVMNLAANAAEAIPDHGRVLISTENRYLDMPIKGYDDVREGDYVVLSVCDTGIGISSQDMKRIFEPFYTKKQMGRSGTGLGMTIVWGTVKDHKGYIDVQTAEGEGTTFMLYFPVTRQESAEHASAVSIEDYKGKGESILVVDDVKLQREIASTMLQKLGYSVTSVSSGEEAVEYLKHNSVDLLVLDMIMEPGIDGLETYKRVLTLHPGQKAIIASGFSETERVKEAQRLGAGAYLKKPYTIEKAAVAIKAELGRTRK